MHHPLGPRQVTRFLILDSYSLLYMAILLGAAGFVFLFGYDYLNRRQEHPEEFYLLVLLATTGAMVLVASRNFASFFLGLELLSVALYALIAYVRTRTSLHRSGDQVPSSGCVIIIRSVIWSRADLFRIGVDGTLSIRCDD